MNTDTGVYAITSPSGKQYIGSAMSFQRRWKRHRSDLRQGVHHNASLQRAWNKYGEENMVFTKLALCSITDLIAIEQARIDLLKPQYNICQVAGSHLGAKRTEEARLKMSLARARWRFTDEQRKTLSRAHLGRRITVETRALISASKVGKPRPDMIGASNPVARAVHCIEMNLQFSTLKAAVVWLRESGNPKADHGGIVAACRRMGSAYGYTWRYVE